MSVDTIILGLIVVCFGIGCWLVWGGIKPPCWRGSHESQFQHDLRDWRKRHQP